MPIYGKPLSELVEEFYNLSRPIGLVIPLSQAQQQAVDAARFFGAYGSFEIAQTQEAIHRMPRRWRGEFGEFRDAFESPWETDRWSHQVVGQARTPATFAQVSDVGKVDYPGTAEVGADVYVTMGEWAIIRPLFVLYVERENAMTYEATRGLGVDVPGRGVAEVTSEITETEEKLMERAFCQGIISV